MEKSRLNNWYAIFVLTGEEDNVKERLKFKLGEEVRLAVPKRRIKERKEGKTREVVKTLFPGYVLIQGDVTEDICMQFRDVPGLVKILGDKGLPYSIDPYEIELISNLIVEDEVIGYSTVLYENGCVRVIDGPMVNLQGDIVSIDRRKGRAKIRVNFCGDERTIDLGVEFLRPENV